MSVQSEITRIQTAVSNSYTAVANKGGTVPASQVISNLPTAINSIVGMQAHNRNLLTSYITMMDTLRDLEIGELYGYELLTPMASQTVSTITNSLNIRKHYWSGIATTYVSNLISAGYTKVYNYDSGYWVEVLSGTTLSGPFCLPVGNYLYCTSSPAETLQCIYDDVSIL